jgi:hypothetical protein
MHEPSPGPPPIVHWTVPPAEWTMVDDAEDDTLSRTVPLKTA